MTGHRTPKVWAIQHVVTEPLGLIGEALEAVGIRADYLRPFAGHTVPNAMGDADALVVMGGPMGVYEQDRYPFLTDEIRLIEHALHTGKPVLGVCLGSQLLATALGVEVGKGKAKEIGWYEVEFGEEAANDSLFAGVGPRIVAYHWHGDVFPLPANAVSLARSDRTECQGFRYQTSVYGLLFHLEATKRIVADMVEAFADELNEERIDGASIIEGADVHLPALGGIAAQVFGRWAAQVKTNASSANA
jgi:GMP synthase (glutamine-hydrolysing)